VSSFPQPDDSRRCTGVSKKNGKRCGNWAIQGTDPGLCSAHSPDSANLILRDPHEAKRRSTERANQRKREAEERDELRRLGLKAMTTKRAENDAVPASGRAEALPLRRSLASSALSGSVPNTAPLVPLATVGIPPAQPALVPTRPRAGRT
jgi:hypothetical protein